jgi:hypothetical protein
LLGASTELGTCRSCVCMLAACPCLLCAGFGRRLRSQAIPGETRSGITPVPLCLPRDQVPFVVLSSSLPHTGDYVHDLLGEQASEGLFVEILHRETSDKDFGSVSAQLVTSVRVLPRRSASYSSGSTTSTLTMGDHHGAAAGRLFRSLSTCFSFLTLHYFLFHLQIC